MFDGPVGAGEMTKAAEYRLRSHYRDRLVDDGKIPQNMRIQGIDVIDPASRMISHQLALKPQIEAIQARGDQACIVIFAPISQIGQGTSKGFAAHSDPNRYAVMDANQARALLGNVESHAGLRANLDRRVNEMVSRPA